MNMCHHQCELSIIWLLLTAIWVKVCCVSECNNYLCYILPGHRLQVLDVETLVSEAIEAHKAGEVIEEVIKLIIFLI